MCSPDEISTLLDGFVATAGTAARRRGVVGVLFAVMSMGMAVMVVMLAMLVMMVVIMMMVMVMTVIM
jgi:hypothetical protein